MGGKENREVKKLSSESEQLGGGIWQEQTGEQEGVKTQEFHLHIMVFAMHR